MVYSNITTTGLTWLSSTFGGMYSSKIRLHSSSAEFGSSESRSLRSSSYNISISSFDNVTAALFKLSNCTDGAESFFDRLLSFGFEGFEDLDDSDLLLFESLRSDFLLECLSLLEWRLWSLWLSERFSEGFFNFELSLSFVLLELWLELFRLWWRLSFFSALFSLEDTSGLLWSGKKF